LSGENILCHEPRAELMPRPSRAGIVGLNTALVLAERGFGKLITVVAEYLPGDTSATYTSPWYASKEGGGK
jgi:hypothetical protein